MSNNSQAIKQASVSTVLSAKDANEDAVYSAWNNAFSAINSAFIQNRAIEVGTGAVGVGLGINTMIKDPSIENFTSLGQSGVGLYSSITGSLKAGSTANALGLGLGAYGVVKHIVNMGKENINNRPKPEDYDGSNDSDDSSSSNNANSSSGNSSESTSNDVEPSYPPTPYYRIEFDDGRPPVYTDKNPFDDKYKGGRVSLLGFNDREYLFDPPIPLDPPKIPDWKDDVNPNNWRDKPNRQGKHYYYDPIVLDLDGDGIETLAHNKTKGAMFDFDADGLKHATGWVKSDDGILVFDRNGDGLINDGREVFGDSTLKAGGSLAKHGFDALADLDSNADGYINQNDDAYKLLKVWQDKNQDGISQADELKTLEELNIQSLNLNYQNTKQNLNGGNELAQIGSYIKTDGTTLKIGDVNFTFDSLYSQHSLAGGGRVRSLHEAIQFLK